MILKSFRSRLKEGIDVEYQEQVQNTAPLAEATSGLRDVGRGPVQPEDRADRP